MPKSSARYAQDLADLRARLSDRCCYHEHEGALLNRCPSRHKLEFAHLAETPLSVDSPHYTRRGRGLRQRALDVRRHPHAYALLCRRHHVHFDNRVTRPGLLAAGEIYSVEVMLRPIQIVELIDDVIFGDSQ